MKARSVENYNRGMTELQTAIAKIKLSESLFDCYKRNAHNDLIFLKDGLSLEILPQYETGNRFLNELAAITQNTDLNRLKLRNDAEITISKKFARTKFEIKNATVIIHSKNNKVDNISIKNPKNSHISLDKDDNDDVSVFSDKIDTCIEKYSK